VALAAVCGTRQSTHVYVPFTLDDQPVEAREVVRRCATHLVEMRLPRVKSSYLARNSALLEGAWRLVAFTDGKETGGTAWTINRARKMGVAVSVVPVMRSGAPLGALEAAWGPPRFSGPVFAYRAYVSARHGRADSTSDLIRRMKVGAVVASAVDGLAGELAAFAQREPELATVEAVVAMPRRMPGIVSDLEPLAAALAWRLRVVYLPGWLARVVEPTGGRVKAFRVRFSPEEHARTLRVVGPARPRRVLVLDNVLSFGGSMEGALRAVIRDAGAQVAGLAALYSEAAEGEA
jgi:adenine/guanine phosphoribosyltransferase-like PRPP-binding protein